MSKKPAKWFALVLTLLLSLPLIPQPFIQTAFAVQPQIVNITAGFTRAFALFSDGSLCGWGGASNDGSLGDGYQIPKRPPTLIGSGFSKVSAGSSHVLALKGNKLYAWGSNQYGQLGNGTRDVNMYMADTTTPVFIGSDFIDISGGGTFSLALKRGGDLYAWGWNEYGTVGDGTTVDRLVPTLIGTGFTAISAGVFHSLALKGDALYAWGRNGFGQLGDGNNTTQKEPKLIGTGFTAIAAGSDHSLALRGDALYAWGCNDCGELGDETTSNRWTPTLIGTGYTAISAGRHHSLALKGDVLYAWGHNYFGQLGDDTYRNSYVPTRIGSGYSMIEAGEFYSLALKGNKLYAWGNNEHGQLGDTNGVRGVPTEVILPIPGNPIPVPESVMLDITKLSLAIGETATLSATVAPTGANQKVFWSTNNPLVATVTRTGKVLAKKVGSAVITATTDNAKKATCAITVKLRGDEAKPSAMAVTISETSMALEIGQQTKLQAKVLPAQALQKVTWSSNDETVATVSPTGVVQGLKSGVATITAYTANGEKATCFISVSQKTEVLSLKFVPERVSIDRGSKLSLRVEITPPTASSQLHYESSNELIAEVTDTGTVTGVSEGSATITVRSDNGQKSTCAVIVKSPESIKTYFNSGFDGKHREFTFSYDDSYFDVPATASLNLRLARASMALAAYAYVSPGSRTEESPLNQMGFDVVEQQNYKKATPNDNDFVAYRIAKKTFRNSGGTEYDLYGLFIRGTPTGYEWCSNFNVGTGNEHAGFTKAADEVYKSFKAKLSQSSRPTKIWITGHSRGAAVANIIAKKLSQERDPRTVYAYTFACPNVARSKSGETNIKNFNNLGDFVTQVPLDAWHYSRSGQDLILNYSDRSKIARKFKELWGVAYRGNYSEDTKFTNALSVLISEPPKKGGVKDNLMQTLGGVIGGKMSISMLEDALAALVLVRWSKQNEIAGASVVRYITDNYFLNPAIQHSHSQELYLAWMDVLVERGSL